MSAEENNKRIFHTLISNALGKGNVDIYDRYASPDFVIHHKWDERGGVDSSPVDEMKERIRFARMAMPDLVVTFEDMVADDETAVARLTIRGTDAATREKAANTGIAMAKFLDGKITEEWVAFERAHDV